MEKTEDTIRRLFDFQRFASNKHLDKIIADCEDDGVLLEDSELDINAAGETDIKKPGGDPKK